MIKKVDERIRTLIENCVKAHHRSMFVIIGDKSPDQFHKKKRAKQVKKLIQRGLPRRDSQRILGNTFGMCILQVIPFDDKGQIDVVIVISLSSITHSWIGDVVFLHDCSSSSPIIAVLYQDESDDMDCYVATRTVSLEDKIFNPGPWSVRRVFHAAESLIPIPYPICGVLVIGNNQIMYRCGEELISTAVEQFVPSANGIFSADGSRYLLGDEKGKIYKLDIIRELGILIKLQQGSNSLQIVESYFNLRGILDFCVVDSEMQNQHQVVACTAGSKDAFLHMIQVSQQASLEMDLPITGLWSLRKESPNDAYLVVSLAEETFVFKVNKENNVKKGLIECFNAEVGTIFCHDALFGLFLHVTRDSVRFVNFATGELCYEWAAKVIANSSINVATATATHVTIYW
ncbi:DNA damage-binding protein 1a [Orobanche gracilis]